MTTYDLREQLAAIEHERWAHWQQWMHAQCQRHENGSLTIPASLVERWERQIATPYADLTEREKDSDRQQVDRYLPLVSPPVATPSWRAFLGESPCGDPGCPCGGATPADHTEEQG